MVGTGLVDIGVTTAMVSWLGRTLAITITMMTLESLDSIVITCSISVTWLSFSLMVAIAIAVMTLTLWASMVVAGFISISWLSFSSSLVITITTVTRIASIASSQTLSAPVDRTITTITIARFSLS